MKKLELKDVTFLINLKIDSIGRLENALVIIDFLMNNFDTEIKVMETSVHNSGILRKLLPKEVSYIYREDLDNIYHRTKYINELTGFCRTQFISVWDADVIIPKKQIGKTMRLLRNKEAHFVTPFEDKAFDTSYILRDLYISTRDITVLDKHQGKMKSMYYPKPIGGVFFADRKSYIEAGMENEKFYGWGREDGERVSRWKILGYKHMHVEGPLFHLTHERGINSTFHSSNQYDVKLSELLRTAAMSNMELKNEIKKWR